MATRATKSRGGGSTGKRYLNTHYGKPNFGPQKGFAPVSRAGANPRAGMSYSIGVTPKGEVVHIYRDGERIVMHQHGQHAAPPHPASFGGFHAPDSVTPAGENFLADLQRQVLAAHQAGGLHHPTNDAQDVAHLAALQSAAAAFSGA
jgi:hypothetical protein